TNPQVPLLAMSLAGGHFFPAPVADTPIADPQVRLDGVPLLQGAEYGLKAVGALMRYAAFHRRRRLLREPAHSPRVAPEARAIAHEVIRRATGTRLSARQGSAVLAAYGIPTPRETLA